jgi:protein-S-isoprenylcysteine O-methyltransferase Ste14
MFVIAGMDSGRLGWSGRVPLAVTLWGVLLMMAGHLLFALAKRENDFFLGTVAIQSDRGHRVCETGPYRFVRHPGYLGMLVSLVAVPLVLQSYWAFIPASLAAVLLILRTLLEDRFLKDRLVGYAEYARGTRWRLIPGVF